MHSVDVEAAKDRYVLVQDVHDLMRAQTVISAILNCDDDEHQDRALRGYCEDRAYRALRGRIAFFPGALARLTDVRPRASWRYYENAPDSWTFWVYTVSYTIPHEWVVVSSTDISKSIERKASS